MAWIILIVAGLIETAWAAGLKYTNGFSRPLPTIATLLGIFIRCITGRCYTKFADRNCLSRLGRNRRLQETVLLGILLFGEPVNAIRMFF